MWDVEIKTSRLDSNFESKKKNYQNFWCSINNFPFLNDFSVIALISLFFCLKLGCLN